MRGRDSRLPLITPPLQLPPSPLLPTNSRVKIPGQQKVFHILGRGKNELRKREREMGKLYKDRWPNPNLKRLRGKRPQMCCKYEEAIIWKYLIYKQLLVH